MKEPNATVEEHARRLAARQHGVVTRQQLVKAGFAEKVVDRRVATGALRPLHRGVYLLGSLRGPLEPKRARVMAAVLACGPGAVASHSSAGWLWGLLRRSGRDAPVWVTIPGEARRERPGIMVRRCAELPPAEITRIDGIPVTAPARTLRDLSTVLSARDLNRAAARAEREGMIDATELPRLVARHAGQPGAPVLRAALLTDGGLLLTRSQAEERLLDLVRSGRLPLPRVNVVVAGYEVDAYWPAEKVAVEVDGFAFHSSRGSFEGDHRRDLDLEAAGITVLRVTWRKITREPTATAIRIDRALALTRAEAT